jgi:hypothetical protein
MIDRELISSRLFALLQKATFSRPLGVSGVSTWLDTGRRLKLFSDVSPSQQPAMYLVAHDEEDVQQGRGIPDRRAIPYSVVCYCRAETGDVGDTFLNTMLAAVEAAIAPGPGPDMATNVQTLGQLVYKCWIKGKIFRDPGDLDSQAMLIVPVEVMVP